MTTAPRLARLWRRRFALAALLAACMWMGPGPLRAQVDALDDLADAGGDAAAGCVDSGCIGACADLGLQVMWAGMFSYHAMLLDKKTDVPEVVSLDVLLHAGYKPGNVTYLLPRLRANWGLFGLDARFQGLFERQLDTVVNFNTLDVGFNFNLIMSRHATLRLGTGFALETYRSRCRHEYTAQLEVRALDGRLQLDGEFRAALSYQGPPSRLEGSGRVSYGLFRNDVITLYASAGVIYQRWFDTVNLWAPQVGLGLNVH